LAAPAEAQNFSADDLARRTIERRAVEAAIWACRWSTPTRCGRHIPRCRGEVQRHLLLLETQDSKFQVTTPNASTNYIYFNYNLKDGPVVIEIPAAVDAGLLGSMVDAWMNQWPTLVLRARTKAGRQVPAASAGLQRRDSAGFFALRYPTYTATRCIGRSGTARRR